jgi:hypothetical protein
MFALRATFIYRLSQLKFDRPERPDAGCFHRGALPVHPQDLPRTFCWNHRGCLRIVIELDIIEQCVGWNLIVGTA